MAKTDRSAFTLTELLVVISIVAILILLVVPAINFARESARRAQCMSNMKRIVFAVQNYERTYGSFPVALPSCTAEAYNSLGAQQGNPCAGPNWAMQIIGHLDADQLSYLERCMTVRWQACDECENQTGYLGRFTPADLKCPSAPIPTKLHESPTTALESLSKGNYVACLGSEHYITSIEGNDLIPHDWQDERKWGVMTIKMIPGYQDFDLANGTPPGVAMFARGQGTKREDITDGMAQTIIISELLTWDGDASNPAYSEDIRGVWTCGSMGASTYSHMFGPNSRSPDRINSCESRIPNRNPLHCELAPPIGPESGETWASARSDHLNGVLAAKADGSVKFYGDAIHLPVWQALATRAGEDN